MGSVAGLSTQRCSVEFTNSTMADNGSGLQVFGLAADAPFTLTKNVFGPRAAGTVHFDGNPHGPVSIHDNVAVDGKTGLILRGMLRADLDWENDELVLLLVTGLTVAPEATLLLAPGSVVKSDLFSGSAIEVNGTLLAEGTSAAPIVFTSIWDDEHAGDTGADGSNITAGPGQWSGVTVNASGGARIAHAEMLYGGNYYYFSYSNALVRAVGGEVSLDDVTLRASNWNAIYSENGSVLVRGSRMEDNYWNVRNDTPKVVVDARHNWWGDPSGPHHGTKNPDGQGKDVTDGVLFFPWAIDADGTVPSQVHVEGPTVVSPGQTVNYAVSYFAGEPMQDGVLVVVLPWIADFVDGGQGATYWPERNEVYWRLGDVTRGTEGARSFRVQYAWGLQNRSTDTVLARLGATNIALSELDVGAYLAHVPSQIVSETTLSDAELAAELSTSADLNALYQQAVSDGFALPRGTRTATTAGETVTEILLIDPSRGAAMSLTRMNDTVLAITFDRLSFRAHDTRGGMQWDMSTDSFTSWGSWSQMPSGLQLRTASNPIAFFRCFFNCAGLKISLGLLKKVSNAVSAAFAAGECYDCLRSRFTDVAACAKCENKIKPLLRVNGVPILGETISVTQCAAQCAGQYGLQLICNQDLLSCDNSFERWAWTKAGLCSYRKIPCVDGVLLPEKSAVINSGWFSDFAKCVEGKGCVRCSAGGGGGSSAQGPQDDEVTGSGADAASPSAGGCGAAAANPGTCNVFRTTIRTAHDPNAKSGPAGDVVPGQEMAYTVEYENVGDGTAYGVYITDELSPYLDETTLDLHGEGEFVPLTRQIVWDIGELAPKSQAGSKGEKAFSVTVKSGLPSGTVITNQAIVYFPSVPEETATNTVVNVVQPLAAAPQSLETAYGTPIGITLSGRDVSGTVLTYTIQEPPLNGKLTGTAPSLSYTPADNFTGQDRFTFTVSNGVSESRTADVTILVTPSSADTIAPELSWTYPEDGATIEEVPADAVASDDTGPLYAPSVLAGFSEAMDPNTIAATTMRVVAAGGRAVAASVNWDGTGNQAVLVPREVWQHGSYRATVTTGVRDASGNPLAAAYEWSFRIGPETAACAGDCNGDGSVTVNELIQGVNIALGTMAVTECPSFDADGNSEVTVSELIKAVNNALTGCEQPGPTAAPTPTVTHGPGGTPTRTPPFF
jgi:hypothetical protein